MIKLFTATDIELLYQTKVKKDSLYFCKYNDIQSYKDGFIETLFSNKDYPRLPCILDFKEWVQKYNIVPQNMLVTSESDFELNYIKPVVKTVCNYNDTTGEGDLHKLNLTRKDYDFFLFSQTLEHLYNPLLAVKNIFEHVSPGGWVFTSVPTINIPHMTPFHFTGIYPIGLAVLFESVGFNIIETGQWGNFNYLEAIFKNQTWPDCNYLMAKEGGKISNEELNVAQCWCLAQKPC